MPETKKIVDAGGIIVEILATKANAPPSEADLRTWINSNNMIVTALIDATDAPKATLNAFGIRETAVIVDLRTMKIVQKINGSTIGAPPSSIKQLLTEMLTLVSK